MPRLPKPALAALNTLDAAQRNPTLSFVWPYCPVCGGQISQGYTGTNRILQHFSCAQCGYWTIIDRAEIRRAIQDSARRMDKEDFATGTGFGGAWFYAITGELMLYCRPKDRTRLLDEVRA